MIYIVVTLTYILILTGIIIYKSRTVKNEDDFVVAGRNVPIYLLVGTLITTWIGSGSLFGTAGLTFRTGFSELWFSMGAWIGIIVVYFIAARVRKIAQYTLTDILEKRYSPLARLLGTTTIILAYLIIAGYQFKGGGRFLNILTEGAISPELGTVITFFLIVAFTALAGMVSIVSIDIFNGIIMISAIVLTLPILLSQEGGWSEVAATINEVSPDHLSMTEGHSFTWYLGILLPTLLLLLSESSMYQKFSSAKDASSAKKAVFGMFVGVVLIEVLMCAISVIGFAIYSDDPRFFLENGDINQAMSEEIILRIGFEQLPPVLGSLLFAGGVAIILSTGNTFLMVASTNLSRDLIEKYGFKGKTLESKKKLMIQRVSIVILGLLAYLMVTQFTTILEMSLISYTMIGASLAPPLLAAFFWKRVTKQGGIAAISGGMVTVLIISVLNKVYAESGLDLGILKFPFDTDYIAIPALIVSVTFLVTFSLLSKPSPEEQSAPFFEK
ncbi:sodium:solute symporter family protein [Marinoscillum pacificum]|uniref:sodium:solute symporter family protein n=1 Tax=Marinoscillum pacificum TaxID=392723 RepID=UPI00215798F3|nr:sodium:solute symporter family protein [Marinoscillum pacificum]